MSTVPGSRLRISLSIFNPANHFMSRPQRLQNFTAAFFTKTTSPQPGHLLPRLMISCPTSLPATKVTRPHPNPHMLTTANEATMKMIATQFPTK